MVLEWGMIRLGASVAENAKATYEEMMGSSDDGHKPMRADIKKLWELWELKSKAQMQPGETDRSSIGEGAEAARKWQDMTQITEVQQKLLDTYHAYVLQSGGDTNNAFEKTIQWATGDPRSMMPLTIYEDAMPKGLYVAEDEPEAKKELSEAIKKRQIAQSPILYLSIKHALDDSYRRTDESYKLWPWMVKQIKEDWQARLSEGELWGNSYQALPGVPHLVDIVTEAGPLLNKLKAENRIPQNFDFQKMNFKQFEEWLMDWKRENLAQEQQGEVVYEFKNDWTMQRLTTPEQLQFEGDEMGHCVGGYSRSVSSGESIIYSLRDKKGEPHVTIEIEGMPALKQHGEKSVDEMDSQEQEDLYHNTYGETDYGTYYPPPLHVHKKRMDDGSYTEYPFENKNLSPHDDPSGYYQYNREDDGHVGPLENKIFRIVQIQGQSNQTPKPEYQTMVREFLDSLRDKGWKFERSDNWYAPHDDPYGDYDEYEYPERIEEARDLDNWWDDHYRTHTNLYRKSEDREDAYGMELPTFRYKPGISDWDELLTSVLGSLVDEYDPGRYRGRWDQSAQQVYHAYIADMYHDEPDEERMKKETEDLEKSIQSAEEKLTEWEWNNEGYALEDSYIRNEIVDKCIAKLEESGEWPAFEKYLVEEHGALEDEYDEWDKGDIFTALQEHDPDLLNEETWEQVNKYYSEDAHRFLNYLYMLVNKHGLVKPFELPDPNQSNAGLPSYDDLKAMPWPSETGTQEKIPGTLSSWHEAAYDEDDPAPADSLWLWPEHGNKHFAEPAPGRPAGYRRVRVIQPPAQVSQQVGGPLDGATNYITTGPYQMDDLVHMVDDERPDVYIGWIPKDEWLSRYVGTGRVKPYIPDTFHFAIVDIGKCARCGGSIGADGYCMVCGQFNDEFHRPQRVPRFQQGMPDPNDRYRRENWVPAAPAPTEKIPGTLSSWHEISAEDPYEIHPIDEEHNTWLDLDGNEVRRYRPAWVRNPDTGKMEETGDMEDTFLDRQGRQGQGSVAYHNGVPVASLTWVDDPAGWKMLGTAYTRPEYRGQGLFNRLVQPLRDSGQPIDAYRWDNPWLKNKVRGWRLPS